ncbi:MAG: hypothetical protein KF781_03040 [Chitinophagaceae bacterium]|nr:hypothetical protein [Chitinophagaceae bacterium]MCW5904487.1 hypothetical protein [Chitinophagaceae bacterium]
MNINRDNYEEFLLLYVDGELNIAEQKAVEQFVQINPDLQEELEILLSTKLTTEKNISFDKSSLYKSEANTIHQNNYVEKFLLYTDNELSEREKKEVEKFVLQHPALQTAFTTIKASILEKEIILHPNKETLYKKERKPVIFMWMKQIAIAAALILFAIALWMLNNNKPTANYNIVVKENNQQSKENKIPAISNNNTKLSEQTIAQQQSNKEEKLIKNELFVQQSKENKRVNNISNNNPTVNEQYNTVVKQEQQNNSVSTQPIKEELISTIIKHKTETITTIEIPPIVAMNTIYAEETTTQNIVQTKNTMPIYKYLDTDDEELIATATSEKVVYIGNMQVSKTKVKHILNKAKTFLGKQKDNPIEKKIASIL